MQKAQHQADQGCLASAIGPEETEDFASPDLQAALRKRSKIPVNLRQMVNQNQVDVGIAPNQVDVATSRPGYSRMIGFGNLIAVAHLILLRRGKKDGAVTRGGTR